MLARAHDRVAKYNLSHVEDLLELDAEDTGLPSASFDIAAAMFVASVVPNPRALLAEMRRVVRPGGAILFINHFSALGGPRLAVERAMAPLALALGWHPDFPFANLLDPEDLARAKIVPMAPFGLFTLVQLTN
jgi:phosphatidylethanolamine/phosphatidyl-N-methylethanolamine N-methyltransferase